jgi:hypothetical protein
MIRRYVWMADCAFGSNPPYQTEIGWSKAALQGKEDCMEIVGRAPDLAGLLCDALICEGFVHHGKLVANANVVYLCFAGV